MVSVAGHSGQIQIDEKRAASDIYAPVSGEVIAVNEDLEDDPGAINSDPFGDGWLFEVSLSDVFELDALLDAKTYEASLEE